MLMWGMCCKFMQIPFLHRLNFTNGIRGTAVLSGTPPNDQPKGGYKVVLLATDGNIIEPVKQEFTIIISWTTGLTQVEKANFAIYPNPTSGLVNLKFDRNPDKDAIMRVYNSTGVLLMEKGIDAISQQIDLSQICPGNLLCESKLKFRHFYCKNYT